jgi:hypothetical protein
VDGEGWKRRGGVGGGWGRKEEEKRHSEKTNVGMKKEGPCNFQACNPPK